MMATMFTNIQNDIVMKTKAFKALVLIYLYLMWIDLRSL